MPLAHALAEDYLLDEVAPGKTRFTYRVGDGAAHAGRGGRSAVAPVFRFDVQERVRASSGLCPRSLNRRETCTTTSRRRSVPENVALLGDQDHLQRIVAGGPRGAWALAGLTVGLLVAIWLAFFLFVFLPRGTIG